MTKSEMAALLTVISVAYPGSRVRADETTIGVWHDALQDLTAAEATLAVKALVNTLKFPPSIADVREAVVNQRQLARGEKSAGEAWELVTRALSKHGYYHPSKAREELGEAIWGIVQQCGGWRALCGSEKLEVFSAQFERRYKDAKEREAYAEKVPIRVQNDFKALTDRMVRQLPGEEGLI